MFNISIVTYNTSKTMLLKVIKSIINAEGLNLIYIVDNSDNENIKNFLPNVPKIQYTKSPKNGGYGFGHNIAIDLSLKNVNVKYHLVLNPDMNFNHIIFKEIKKYMDENPIVGNLMPKVLYNDGTVQYLCKLLPTPYDWIGRRFNPITSIIESRNRYFELRFMDYNSIMEVPYLSGCFMFLRLSSLKKIGNFDENIFMYGEETDLCRRLIDGGYKNIYFPNVSVFHEFQKGSHKSLRLTFIGIKSAIYYFNKWGWIIDKKRREINRYTLEYLNTVR
ncbi:MAG: glycosyltransferase [Lutibacter sp.]|nr:glycosyltransferase [Lutibacter sp.]